MPSYPCDRDICAPLRYSPVLLLYRVANVTIRGNGTLNGSGSAWWRRFHARQNRYGRPRLLQIMSSSDVGVFGVTLQDSPFWTTHIWNSSRVEVAHVRVRSPRDSPNTDGVDPDSSSDVHVHDCDIHEGDDCIAVKSGLNAAGVAFGVPCQNVLIERCTCVGQAYAVGSEMSGGVRNVTFRNCSVDFADGGLHVKTSRQRGGYIRDVVYDGIRGLSAVVVNFQTDYEKHGNASSPLPVLDGFVFRNVRMVAGEAGLLACTESIPCSNVTLQDLHITSPIGFRCGPGVRTSSVVDVHPRFCSGH